MAIMIHTKVPCKILSDIIKMIQCGKCQEWKLDTDGDLTHSSLSYEKKAWLHAILNLDDQLIFALYGRKDEPMTKSIYAAYHCLFAEFILRFFDADITKIEITSMPTTYDVI